MVEWICGESFVDFGGEFVMSDCSVIWYGETACEIRAICPRVGTCKAYRDS